MTLDSKTRDLIECGSMQEDRGTESHPPNQQRIEFLKKLYKQQNFRKSATVDLDVEDALTPGKTLEYLWSKIQNQFVNAFRQGRPLCPIWHFFERDVKLTDGVAIESCVP
ncbi:MAG: hypothetical protein WB781_11835 [Candidatus Sulfotelmatobacter sp.]